MPPTPHTRTARFPTRNGPRLPYLVYRTTPRDRWILRMLHEHRLLTGPDLYALAFTNVRVANRRLATLTELALTDRFRPPRAQYGNQPWHYTLGPAGATIIAAERATTPSALGYQRTKLLAQAARPDLPHTTGCNTALTRLAATARHTVHAHRLTVWWSAYSAQAVWGDMIRPDAYAVWENPQEPDPRTACAFFYEYDTGTESLIQLLGKLPGYRRLRDQQNASHPILLHLPNPTREQHLHEQLRANPPGLPIATTNPHTTSLALGATLDADIWLPTGGDHRHPLTTLPAALTALGHPLAVPVRRDPDVHAPTPLPDPPHPWPPHP